MTRKGKLSQILSKALYNDDPDLYLVGYLDFNDVKETTLPEFIRISENFETIPATRIVYIKRENSILYSKSVSKKE
ncbi:MAG: DUF504 domain-containing protein [Nitrosotalea sp.]